MPTTFVNLVCILKHIRSLLFLSEFASSYMANEDKELLTAGFPGSVRGQIVHALCEDPRWLITAVISRML